MFTNGALWYNLPSIILKPNIDIDKQMIALAAIDHSPVGWVKGELALRIY